MYYMLRIGLQVTTPAPLLQKEGIFLLRQLAEMPATTIRGGVVAVVLKAVFRINLPDKIS
jgi:hypothetical protein